MAYSTSSERYSSHISTTDDSISSSAHPSAADRARYPNLYPTAEEVIYSSQRASQSTEITPISQQLLLDRPSGTYHYSHSLTPRHHRYGLLHVPQCWHGRGWGPRSRAYGARPPA